MNLDRFDRTARVLVVAPALLVVDQFLAWQQACVGAGGIRVCGSASGWSGIGLLLGVLALALLAWEGLQLTSVRLSVLLPRPLVSAGLAGAVLLFALIKFLVDGTARHWPAYVGIALAAAVAYGGWRRLMEGGGGELRPGRSQTPAG